LITFCGAGEIIFLFGQILMITSVPNSLLGWGFDVFVIFFGLNLASTTKILVFTDFPSFYPLNNIVRIFQSKLRTKRNKSDDEESTSEEEEDKQSSINTGNHTNLQCIFKINRNRFSNSNGRIIEHSFVQKYPRRR
jgi:hypothetical protein